MNYDQAREIRNKDGNPSGKWHFTRMNDGQIWPIGFCRENCPGHDTAEEAEKHWYDYECSILVVDNFHNPAVADDRERCEVPGCEQWTNHRMRPQGDYGAGPRLCGAHLNVEGYKLARPFEPGIVSIHS